MHFHATWIGLLTALPSVWGFWPIDDTETAGPYPNDAPTVKVETFQFPNNGSWIDNLALRSDGSGDQASYIFGHRKRYMMV